MNESVPVQLRLRAIEAIKTLYQDCFTPRCAPVLGHLNEPGANPLNQVCYMLWDASPLSYWENRPNREVFYGAVVDVLEMALKSPNPARVESALMARCVTVASLRSDGQSRAMSRRTGFVGAR